MNAVVEQRRTEADLAVANIATAIGISFSQDALTQWQAGRGGSERPEIDPARAAMQSATIARLAGYGWRGGCPIRVRKPD